ncbi:MAG: PIN domain-containing protein [Holophagaceae bacterium]|nr:PIN domain-containing protein [Holophagaceae bacterium]
MKRVPLFTFNYVLDETITRIRYDGGHALACQFCDLFGEAENRGLITTLWVDEDVVRQARDIFRRYSDQKFSFTDCTSFVLMKKHGISEVFAFDAHFETLGFLRYPSH